MTALAAAWWRAQCLRLAALCRQQRRLHQHDGPHGHGAPQSSTTNFDWRTEPAFAIWAGYDFGEGLGVRARWFHLDASTNTLNTSLSSPAAGSTIGASPTLPTLAAPLGATLFGSPGLLLNNGVGQDLLTFSSSLRIDTVDAEATYTCGNERWNFVFAGGGRFMTMAQSYHARLNNNPGDGVTFNRRTWTSPIPSTAAVRRLISRATWRVGHTNFSLFGNTRAAPSWSAAPTRQPATLKSSPIR